MKILSVIFLSCILMTTSNPLVSIKITDIETKKGVILLSVFKTAENYDNNKPDIKKKLSKASLKDGVLKHQLNLPQGTYGIAVLDDENENQKMDYNFIKYPLEGYGFSNFYHTNLSKPVFDDFKFRVNDEDVDIHIRMRYL